MNTPAQNQPPQPPQNPQPQNHSNLIGLLGIFLVAMGCLIMVCVIGSGYLLIRYVLETGTATLAPTPTGSVSSVHPTATPMVSAPANTSTPGVAPTALPKIDLTMAEETLKTLSQSEVPINDPLDLAHRLQGKPVIAPTLPGKPTVYQVGDSQSFWIVNGDTDEQSQVKAKLAYITPHLYFWIQEGVRYNAGDLQKLCDTFENKIYPTDREFFGSEWTPGVDNDPHLYVLYTRGLGSRVAGYFSSADEIPPAASPYSNGHEMFVMNSDSFSNLSDIYVYTVLAHEFQHMIHWYTDRNEESWLNEGFSELAAFLNGYDIGGHDFLFARNPDIQLTDWPNDRTKTSPHYGASFLFLDYFLNRMGEKATQKVVANPANGLVSIDQVLAQENITDPATGQPVTADDVFVDWSLTNYLDNPSVGDGRYTYANYPGAPSFTDTESIRSCPTSTQTRTVSQYGTDYIRIRCRGNVTLSFQGDQEVGVLPVDVHSGNYALWSNKGDESDMTLSQTFDFTNLQGPISMNYWTWYDLEEHYDYLYLVATTDGGNTWQIVKTPSCTEENITGANFGCGYNGKTNTWIQEKVDLSQFAGQKVTLQFEYITDAAVNGEGLLLDDMEIPQIGYKSDFETDTGGWQAAGFVRLQNRLPQTFRVSLISDGSAPSVQYLQLEANQSISLPLNLTSDVTLVVNGTTRFTRLPANYTFRIDP